MGALNEGSVKHHPTDEAALVGFFFSSDNYGLLDDTNLVRWRILRQAKCLWLANTSGFKVCTLCSCAVQRNY